MTAAQAFVGALVQLDPGIPGAPMVAHVALPRGEFDLFTRAVGTPGIGLGGGPSVVLLRCLPPRYPVQADDAVALALARELNRILVAGAVHATSELRRELVWLAERAALRASLWRDRADPSPATEEDR